MKACKHQPAFSEDAMRANHRSGAALAMVMIPFALLSGWAVGSLGGSEGPAKKGEVAAEAIAEIREAARHLTRDIGYLQEEIAADSAKERAIYALADAATLEASSFMRSLKPGMDAAAM